MTFDQWWQTLTPAEQKTIGINNARFVWQAAIAEAEQGPVGWMDSKLNPIKREWVGLTDEDVKEAVLGDAFGGASLMSLMRDEVMVADVRQAINRIAYAIEAKLKEMNK
jgi:hypothetical protein